MFPKMEDHSSNQQMDIKILGIHCQYTGESMINLRGTVEHTETQCHFSLYTLDTLGHFSICQRTTGYKGSARLTGILSCKLLIC